MGDSPQLQVNNSTTMVAMLQLADYVSLVAGLQPADGKRII